MLLSNNEWVLPDTPIYPGSYFTWGEATSKCTRTLKDLVIDGKLIISSSLIADSIIQTAHNLDKVRELLGNRPLYVNSWYRPQHINARVGGAIDSRHQYGDAVDIRSDYFTPVRIYKTLDAIHNKGGLGKYPSFVHIDWRGERARW
jgi:zinc D-Ala-D-Ala carboxypeptidase